MTMRSLGIGLGIILGAGCASAPKPATPTPSTNTTAVAGTAGLALSDAPDVADRVRIAEAYRLAGALGDSLWSGWSSVPFTILLVTPTQEYLFGHPHPTSEFRRVLDDASLGGAVYVRPRVFSPNLLATFPAVGGVPTVVVGQPAQTGKSSTEWVLTLLHEHFHQLQMSAPGYATGTLALGLTRGDTTGMWMLNYPFPYDSAAVQQRVERAWRGLRTAVGGAPATRGGPAMAVLRASLDTLRAGLAPDDYRYLAFQLWQEGVARYTEYAMAERAAAAFAPSAGFLALPDAEPFAAAAARLRQGIVADSSLALGTRRRVAFYRFGAAAALALDAAGADWRRGYPGAGYALDSLLH